MFELKTFSFLSFHYCFILDTKIPKVRFSNPLLKKGKLTKTLLRRISVSFKLGVAHLIRNAIFRDFGPPSPFVTQNRTNPYIFERRNKSLTPHSPYIRIIWTTP